MIYGALFVILWSVFLMNSKAIIDAKKFKGQQQINHRSEAEDFVLWVAIGILIAVVVQIWNWREVRGLFEYPALAWSISTMSFRLLLNHKRTTDKFPFPWNYVTPSNHYDRILLRRYWYDGDWTTQEMIDYHHKHYNGGRDQSANYTAAVHRAGTACYRLEGIVFLLSCIWIVYTQFH